MRVPTFKMESNHNEDESTMQQALLDKLMQYGDSLLDTEDYEQRKAAAKKKRKKHKKERQSQDSINLPPSSKELSIPKLKKLKECNTEQSHEDSNSDSLKSDELRQRKRKRRTLREFEEELRVFKEARDSDPVESKEYNVVEKSSSGPEVIVFDDPAKRKKKNKLGGSSQSSESNFDLNKARLEVQKFGYSGFDYADRRKFEQERAIRLGAKPPKRDYVNYKLYMEQLKQKRAEELKQKEIDRKIGLKVTTSKSGDRDINKTVLRHHGFWKDRSTEKGFHLDGQVGRYRPGVLWLTRKDIVGVTGKANKTGRKTNNNTGGKSDMIAGKAEFGGKSSKTGGKFSKTGGKSSKTGGKRKSKTK